MSAMTKPRGKVQYSSTSLNVYDAALERIRWLFDEFDNDVAVSNSGGKDSTVTLELASIVNQERNLPPLRVIWLDQECEFNGTVEYQRYLLNERDDLDFHWYQVPFLLDNATNSEEKFLHVWGPGEEWVRPKEPNTIHSTDIQLDRFYDLLSEINAQTAPCVLSGMRSEESPVRRMTLTAAPAYKWVTWSTKAPQKKGRDHFRFHPIYDWSYRDVWKAIDQNGWRYNEVYDAQYQWGVSTSNMRVSNYHHETSVYALQYLQETEPETWEAATRRLQGISTNAHLGDQVPARLPYMFASWTEYLNHLIDNLIPDDGGRDTFRAHHIKAIRECPHVERERIDRMMVRAVILNDQWGTTIENFITSQRRTIAQKADDAQRRDQTEEAVL